MTMLDEATGASEQAQPEVPIRRADFEAREAFADFAKDHPEPRDEMRVVHRAGQVRTVYFLDVNDGHALVQWPIANDVIEVSLKTGDLKIKRGHALWRLAPGALAACRRLRSAKKKKLHLLVPGGK